MAALKSGDKVTSNILGYYYGVPGTVFKEAQMQYGKHMIYEVQLDNGKKVKLAEVYLDKLHDKDKPKK